MDEFSDKSQGAAGTQGKEPKWARFGTCPMFEEVYGLFPTLDADGEDGAARTCE
jgi:hypothetical protein